MGSHFRITLIPAMGKTRSTVLAAVKQVLTPVLQLSRDSVALTPLVSTTGPTEYYTCSIHAPWQITAHARRIRHDLDSLGYANLPAPDVGWVVLRPEFPPLPRSAFDLSALEASLPRPDAAPNRAPPPHPPPKRRRVSFGEDSMVG